MGLTECSEGKAIEKPANTPISKLTEAVLCAPDFCFLPRVTFWFNMTVDSFSPKSRNNVYKVLLNPKFLLPCKFVYCKSQL